MLTYILAAKPGVFNHRDNDENARDRVVIQAFKMAACSLALVNARQIP